MSGTYYKKRNKSSYRLEAGWILAAVFSILVIVICGEKLIAFRNKFQNDTELSKTENGSGENGIPGGAAGGDTNDGNTSGGGTGDNQNGMGQPGGLITDPTGNENSKEDAKDREETGQSGNGTAEPTGPEKPGNGTAKPTGPGNGTAEPTGTEKPGNGTAKPTGTENVPTKAPEENETKKLIAFTFDDGPFPAVTSRILDVMEENGAKATFFVMGNRMSLYPDMVKRAVELGCQIGNHTYSHKNLVNLDASGIVQEVEYSNQLINEVVEVGDVLLRPPYGNHNELVDKTVKVPMIAWSIDSEDWKSKNKDSVIEEIMKNLHDGDIVLMHDLYSTTADAVEYLVPELIKKGYEFVTVSELFERRGIEAEAGKLYRKAWPKKE